MSWLKPLEFKPTPKIERKPHFYMGRAGRRVEVEGQQFKSLTKAARHFGVNRHVIDRLIRDGKARFVT